MDNLGRLIPRYKIRGRKRVITDLVEAKFPKLNGRVEINSIGTTIGSHTGPGTVALFFWGGMRTE